MKYRIEELNSLYKFIEREKIQESSEEKLAEKIADIRLIFQLLNKEDIRVCLYLVAIDTKKPKFIINLNNYYLKEEWQSNENTENIYYILYNRRFLNRDRIKKVILMSLIENIQFKINFDLFKLIVEYKDIATLKILLENIFYDNKFILLMLHSYKHKIPYSYNQFKTIFHNEMTRVGLNEKDKDGSYPVLWACIKKNTKIVETLLMNYTKYNLIQDLNEKNKEGLYPLLQACYNNNIEMTKLLINYSDSTNNILKINDKDRLGNYPLLKSCRFANIKLVKLLIRYANKNNIILKVNERDFRGDFPILDACNTRTSKILEILMKYADKNSIALELNGINDYGYSPLMLASLFCRNRPMKYLIKYANKNNIILDIYNVNGKTSPVECAIDNLYIRGDIRPIILIMRYAKKHKIKMDEEYVKQYRLYIKKNKFRYIKKRMAFI